MLTSDNEGMPVSLIEAASVGIPAVTTRVGSAPEVVLDGVTGLVTTTDAVELGRRRRPAARRRWTCGRRLGDAARRRASERIAPRRLVEDIAGLYEQVVARVTRGRDVSSVCLWRSARELWVSFR